jgi:uncharacterized protein Yka (UPF0111/DUF47 family)
MCGRSCELETCVVDERGRAVHKSCYHHEITSKTVSTRKYDEVEELLKQAQELREVADRLLAKSDALIAAYKQLTGQAKRQPSHSE